MNEPRHDSLADLELYRLLLDEATDPIFSFTRDGTYRYVNRAFAAPFGKQPHEIIGKRIWDIFSQEEADKRYAAVAAAFASRQTQVIEVRVPLPSGDRYYITSVKPVLDAAGQATTVICISKEITEHKRAEEALRESEAMYRSLFDNMLNGFAYCQMHYDASGAPDDFTYLAVNAAFEVLTGLKGVVGKKVSEVIPGIREADPKLFEIYGRVAAAGQPERFEMFIASLQMWFAVAVYCPRRGYFVAVFDVITERKRAEESLQQSETRLAESNQIMAGVLEHTHMMAVLLDPHFNFIWVNRAYAATCGYPPSFFPGKNHFDLYPNAENQAIFQRVVDTGQPFFVAAKPFEFPDQPERGVTYWDWSLIPIKDAANQVVSLALTLADVTERIRAEEALRKSEEQYRTLADNIQDYIMRYDRDFRHVYANSAAIRVAGRTPEQYIGKTHREMGFPEELCALWERNIAKVFATGQPCREVFDWQSAEGVVTLDWRVAPEFAPDGSIATVLAVSRDVTALRQSEAALRASREYLQAVFDSTHDAVMVDDAHTGQIIDVNQRMCEMYGYTREEALATPIGDLSQGEPPYSHADALAWLHKAREAGPQTFEWLAKHKSGRLFWVEVTIRFVQIGEQDRFVVTVHDIDERKRAEEALERRLVALTRPLEDTEGIELEDLFNLAKIQELQDQFAEATGVASLIIRPDGSPITKPSRFCRLCDMIRSTEQGAANCRHSDAIMGRREPGGPIVQPCLSSGLWDAGANITVGGRHIANWLIGQVRNEAQSEEQIRAYAREIGVDEEAFAEAFYEVPVMPQEQFERVAQVLFTLAQQLSDMAYQNVQQARFIAERQKAEQELKNRERLLNQIFDTLPIGLWFADKEGRLIRGNAAGVRIWGAEPLVPIEEYGVFKARRLPSREEIAPDDWALAHTIREGVTLTDEELEIDAFDGEKRIILNYTAPVLDEDGVVQGAIVLNQDITARKRAEEEAARLQEQLIQAQKMESVGRLAGGVAHDFNNMLQAILGHAELALAEMGADNPWRESIQEIQQAARRSADLTRQLLAFAQRQTITPRVLDLNDTLAGMLRMLQRLIGEDIHLAWSPGNALWPVKMDPSQLDQILANLAVNARDAIDGVGQLTIETSNVSLDAAYCAAHPDATPGDYVLLSVSDTGCGMSEETLSHLFEPFFTTKGIGKGTGLGLATVYGIISQNHGHISVESKLGQGSTFRIYLPRYQTPAPQASADQPPKGMNKGAGTVLMVEDEPAILDMTQRMLQRLGYTVLAASSPAEALRLAREHAGAIHLLLTDVVMPTMNGRDLAAQVRAICPAVKCLFMSGYTADILAQEGAPEPDVRFIPKPFTLHDLAAAASEVLKQNS